MPSKDYLSINPFPQLTEKMRAKVKKNLPIAAMVLVTESIKYVPIFSGRLRRSWDIVESADGVDVVFDSPYANIHYYKPKGKRFPLRHIDRGNGRPGSIADAISAPEKKRITKRLGSDPAAHYRRLYEAANDAKLLTVIYPDGQRWLERAWSEVGVRQAIKEVLVSK